MYIHLVYFHKSCIFFFYSVIARALLWESSDACTRREKDREKEGRGSEMEREREGEWEEKRKRHRDSCTYGDVLLSVAVPVDDLQQTLHHSTGHQGFYTYNDSILQCDSHSTSTHVLHQHTKASNTRHIVYSIKKWQFS